MTRFTSECDLCAELLAEYISAGNETVDTKIRSLGRTQPSTRQLAAALINHALKRRDEARKRLLEHKAQRH